MGVKNLPKSLNTSLTHTLIMKEIRIVLEDKELEKFLKIKENKSWKELFLTLIEK